MTPEKELRELESFAKALDSQFRLPFGLRIGWDGLIGLVPGIGDAATSLLSLYLIYKAAVLGCSPWVLARMGLNVAFDSMVGAVPVAGDLLDFVWKSNEKNLRLLKAHLKDPRAARKSSRWVIVLTVVLIVLVLTAAVALAIVLARGLWERIASAGSMI